MKLRLSMAEMDTWLVEIRESDEDFVLKGDEDFSSPRKFLQKVASEQPPTVILYVHRIHRVRVDDLDLLTFLRLSMTHKDAKAEVKPLKELK